MNINNLSVPDKDLQEIEKRAMNGQVAKKKNYRKKFIVSLKIFAIVLGLALLADIVSDYSYWAGEFGKAVPLAIAFLVFITAWNMIFIYKLNKLGKALSNIRKTIYSCNFIVIMETIQTIVDWIVFIVLVANMKWTVLYVGLVVVLGVIGLIKDWGTIRMIKNLLIEIIR